MCPGGMPAASTLSSDRKLMYIMMKQHKEQKLIAAISSAPTIVLNSIGILENRHATCYPLLSFIGADTSCFSIKPLVFSIYNNRTSCFCVKMCVQIAFERIYIVRTK